METGTENAYDILNENLSIFEDIKPKFDDFNRNMSLPPRQTSAQAVMVSNTPTSNHEHIEDIEVIQEVKLGDNEDVFSLEKQEKEIIIKALKKNKLKRKYAAKDLGISERTLYRKIKQYDLEDLS
jgi:transcriptional regulator with PAS, ATPase and Fis domain